MTTPVATTQGWRRGKLKSLPVVFIDGDRSARYPKRHELQDEGVLFLNTKNVVENHLDLNEADYVSQEKFAGIQKGRLKRFDIVMTTRGTVGKVALFNHPKHSTSLINAQMLILRAHPEHIDPQFLFYALCSDTFQGAVRNYASGSAQPQVKSWKFCNFLQAI